MSQKEIVTYVENFKIDLWDKDLQMIVEDMLIGTHGKS